MENSRYRAFLASVETGSFSKAAEQINYTPSGVCQLVNALEKEFGFQILTRGRHGVKPTSEGEMVLDVIRDMLHQEERLTQLSADINGLAVGEISVGSYSSVATHWLPAVIKEFQQMYPCIKIKLMEGIRQENEAWLESRQVDLAFISHGTFMPYDWIPLAEDPMVAILPADHPLAGAEAYPLENCQYERFIMPGKGNDEDVLAMFQKNHLAPKIAFSTLENFATLAMIEQGMGMSIMNDLITKRWQFSAVKLPLIPPQSITLGIAISSYKLASPAVRRFADFATQKLQK